MWRDLHPEWAVAVWSDNDLPSMTNQDLFDQASEFNAEHSVYQFQADVLRYELLLRYGGVWVDADFEPLKPIDPLCFEHPEGWGTSTLKGRAANAIMAFPPGHPAMAAAVDQLPVSVRTQPRKGNADRSGPGFVDPLFHMFGVHRYPASWFFPYSVTRLNIDDLVVGPEVYAVHHYNNPRTRLRLGLADDHKTPIV